MQVWGWNPCLRPSKWKRYKEHWSRNCRVICSLSHQVFMRHVFFFLVISTSSKRSYRICFFHGCDLVFSCCWPTMNYLMFSNERSLALSLFACPKSSLSDSSSGLVVFLVAFACCWLLSAKLVNFCIHLWGVLPFFLRSQQGSFNFLTSGWDPCVWAFKWKLLISTLTWYCLLLVKARESTIRLCLTIRLQTP